MWVVVNPVARACLLLQLTISLLQTFIRALAAPVMWEWRLGRALRSLAWLLSCGCCSRRRRAEVRCVAHSISVRV
jgi:hypothetical protein